MQHLGGDIQRHGEGCDLRSRWNRCRIRRRPHARQFGASIVHRCPKGCVVGRRSHGAVDRSMRGSRPRVRPSARRVRGEAARSPEQATGHLDRCFEAIRDALEWQRTADAISPLNGLVGSVGQATRLANFKELDHFTMNSDAPLML